MKKYLLLFIVSLSTAALAQNPAPTSQAPLTTGTITQQVEGQKIFHSSGLQDAPFVGYSQSGASAGIFNQDTHFNSPAVTLSRSGTAGGEMASSPLMLVTAGLETTGTSPVLQIGGCLALSGDNWLMTWGDGALSLPGGILDNTGKVHGKIAIDPVHRQLLAEDGITPILTWTGSHIYFNYPATASVDTATGIITAKAIVFAPQGAPSSPTIGTIYCDNTSDHHFWGWNGSAWKQLDN